MFCAKCGNKLDDDAVFCDECGAKIVIKQLPNVRSEFDGTQKFLCVLSALSALCALITFNLVYNWVTLICSVFYAAFASGGKLIIQN